MNEEIAHGLLERLLPKRFSIGTGLIITATGEVSSQQDIVIYDNIYNSPILTEFSVRLFPIECVYGTMEVKTTLTPTNLAELLEKIRTLRNIGRNKVYINSYYDDKGKVGTMLVQTNVPPRSYILAFRQRGFGRDFEQFKFKVAELCKEEDSHIHGLTIISSDWFVLRTPHRTPAEIVGWEGHALAHLYRALLEQSVLFPVFQADMERYLR